MRGLDGFRCNGGDLDHGIRAQPIILQFRQFIGGEAIQFGLDCAPLSGGGGLIRGFAACKQNLLARDNHQNLGVVFGLNQRFHLRESGAEILCIWRGANDYLPRIIRAA